MVGEDEAVPVADGPDQGEAQQGRDRQVEALGALFSHDLRDVFVASAIIDGRWDIDRLPRHLHVRGDAQDGSAEARLSWNADRRFEWRRRSACA